MTTGKFIVIEGGDACGKNTQSKRLHERLVAWLHNEQPLVAGATVADRELATLMLPGPLHMSFPRYDTPLGKAILRHLKGYVMLAEEHVRDSSDHEIDGTSYHVRAPEDALAFQCMMIADKYAAADKIELQLASGGHVVSDRWWQSGLIYGSSDGLDAQWLLDVYTSLPLADLNILIDVPVEIAMARREVPRDRYEESKAKREDIRSRYLDLWNRCSAFEVPLAKKWVIVNGTMTPDQVEAEILSHVGQLLTSDDDTESPTT